MPQVYALEPSAVNSLPCAPTRHPAPWCGPVARAPTRRPAPWCGPVVRLAFRAGWRRDGDIAPYRYYPRKIHPCPVAPALACPPLAVPRGAWHFVRVGGAMVGRHRPWGLPTLPARALPL